MKDKKIRKLKSFINMCGIEAQKNIGSSDFDIWEERRKKAEKEIRQILLKEKQKFNIAMEEMECWKCETHLKECKKCRQNLLNQEREEIREKVEKMKGKENLEELYKLQGKKVSLENVTRMVEISCNINQIVKTLLKHLK